jgi:hypothetical protein
MNRYLSTITLLLVGVVSLSASCMGGSCASQCASDSLPGCHGFLILEGDSCYETQASTCLDNECGSYNPMKYDCLFTCEWEFRVCLYRSPSGWIIDPQFHLYKVVIDTDGVCLP